jgi:DDE superfamily endonuclease/Winged helix-turn helix
MTLSTEEKWRIVWTYKSLRNVSRVAVALKYTRKTVQTWLKRYKETGTVERMQPGGRKRLLSETAEAAAAEALVSKRCCTTKDVAVDIHAQGLTSVVVGSKTIIRALRRHASNGGPKLSARRGQPRKELTAANKQQRLAFALANKSTNWGAVLFTDRKRFSFKHPGTVVRPCQWLVKGEQRQAFTVNHAQGVNLYAGISMHGVSKAHIVSGTSKLKTQYTNKKGEAAKNITAAEYSDVLNKTLLPGGRLLFSTQGVSSWRLMQDNDPTHRVAGHVLSCYNTKHSSSIRLLQNWPPNSPDLNPIENVWAWVDAKVNALGCKTFEQYQQAVLDQLQAVPKTMLRNLINSMPKRLAQVIKLEGGRTKY